MLITEAAASVAARAFFYPSLAWNIARNRLQAWSWWDEITEVSYRCCSVQRSLRTQHSAEG